MADQLALALADRHAGQQRNLAANQTGYRDHRSVVETALATLARNRRPFCADDVHRLVAHELPDGYDRNIVSSAMGLWAKDTRIRRCYDRGLTPSAHRARKGSRNSWWQGNTTAAPLPRAAS